MKHLLIGITSSENQKQNLINLAYIKAFNKENITPIIIPNLLKIQNEIITEKEKEKTTTHINILAEKLDALILSGGVDLNPTTFNETIEHSSSFNHNRDIFETELIKTFIEKKKPILGICRGFQLLGKYFDLKYFQQSLSSIKETHNAYENDITNRKEPMHFIRTFGKFKEYCKEDRILINSWHNQGFTLHPKGEKMPTKNLEYNTVNPNIDIIACTNYVIEGFEHKTLPIVAFQNHPEEYLNSIAINYFLDTYLPNK